MGNLNEEYGFPVIGTMAGEPIPDLSEISQSRWAELVAPLSERVLRRAVARLATNAELATAMGVWLDGQRALRAQAGAPRALPRHVAAPAPRRPPKRGHQVNVRLYGRDFAALTEAARLAGTTRTDLARWFIVSGSRRMVYEERRAQTAAPRSSS